MHHAHAREIDQRTDRKDTFTKQKSQIMICQCSVLVFLCFYFLFTDDFVIGEMSHCVEEAISGDDDLSDLSKPNPNMNQNPNSCPKP